MMLAAQPMVATLSTLIPIITLAIVTLMKAALDWRTKKPTDPPDDDHG